MPAISDVTRTKIIAHLEVFIENWVEDYRGSTPQAMISPSSYLEKTDKKGRLKPFHSALVPPEVLRISAFERGLVTRLGTSFEECAKLIALEHHQDAIRGHILREEVSEHALAEIESQVATFEHTASNGNSRRDLQAMIESVLIANRTGQPISRDKKTDLYVRTHNNKEYYFEMKSPKPNKDQCLRITQGILQIHALRKQGRPEIKSYLALPYNPFGNSRADYNWTYPKNYMPYEEAVLIGDEFWALIGGPTTYLELLELYQYVGSVKGKYVAEALAFDL